MDRNEQPDDEMTSAPSEEPCAEEPTPDTAPQLLETPKTGASEPAILSADGDGDGDGVGKEWFDRLYSTLDWLPRHPSVWQRLPRRGQQTVVKGINYLLPYQEHRRHLTGRRRPWNTIEVSDGERINVPRLWVVEFFPPSEHENLRRYLERNSWDRAERDQENRKRLDRSRSHVGRSWWRIGGLKQIKSSFFFPDFGEGSLHPSFEAVCLYGHQIGSGTTAVVAEFFVSDEASDHLDQVWRTQHGPELVKRRGMRPLAEDSAWVTMRRTQETRRALHDAARDWMAEKLPGSFASKDRRHSAFDLLLFQTYHPQDDQPPSGEWSASLRALGLTQEFIWLTSDSLPGFVLQRTEPDLCRSMGEAPSWGLVGSLADIPESMVRHRGSDKPWAVSSYVSDVIRSFFVKIALTEFLGELERSYAKLRDSARRQHRQLKGKYAKELQEGLITFSLDINALARDVKSTNEYGLWPDEAMFTMGNAPWVQTKQEPLDYNKVLAEAQTRMASDLSDADRDYREVLTAVSALGASVDAFRVSRLALWVAGATLLLTAVTLAITDVGDHTIWHWLARQM
ncbi:hypothetical protein [Streptantibioticus ferralitis]|uniref:Uncharacterized protein n=1 Tax=Streptantibioticus ferralitis TaxID=236510 RepID=A0ABT5Z0J9_9ACTN|nr:hypothetical protein [Streptantibioticus ferralitis]MDF2257315.1 hypothetical protein [Streptantibioticus ferralitis]